MRIAEEQGTRRRLVHRALVKAWFLAVVVLGLGVGVMASPDAHAAIQLSTEEPTAGEPVTITLDEPIESITIVYRPNSSVVHEVPLKADGPTTRFLWIPEQAGIVTLRAGSATRSLSVRFGGFPLSGLLIMLAAAGILFGGAAFAFRILFRNEDEDGAMDYDTSPRRHPDT